MASAETEYISVGGNRHPAAADWNPQTGLLAFGAANNVALWYPKVDRSLCFFKRIAQVTDRKQLGPLQ